MLKLRFAVIVLGLCLAGWVNAYDLPPLNLGFTSFLDGGPPAGPGWYWSQYGQYYRSRDFVDSSGHEIQFPKRGGGTGTAGADVYVSLTQLIYQSDQKLCLGGKWGVEVIAPYANLSQTTPGLLAPLSSGGGLGDITVGPFLQWDPIMGANGPLFMQRIELQTIWPTGKYENDRQLNPGSNYFSFDPYWAGTLWLTPKWTSSLRAHYLWNDRNNDVAGGGSTRAGQAFHCNFATDYEVVDKTLSLGVNGYYLQQTTDMEANGAHVANSKERVVGVGPGLIYHISKDLHVFVNVYFETLAQNRPQGQRYNARMVYHF